ncbi:ECF transporter S component [Spiroplasma endosymbiont of Othius punctulatus]|uniref:ECF transporter S component n=1 Tax=Spiroplasma endosymbiont of Othius punctulatus TaxID=3066289 RepID=UPI0030CE6CFE
MLKERLRQTIIISNKQIVTLGICVALALILSAFTLIFSAIGAPMAIELTFFTYLIAWRRVNVFYGFVVLTISTWMRMLYIPDPFGGAGVLTLFVSDLSQFFFFVVAWYIFGLIRKLNTEKSVVKFIIAYLVAMIFTIIIMTLFVIYFLIPTLIPTLMDVPNWQYYYFFSGLIGNTIKYSVNLIIFIPIYTLLPKL